MSNIYTLKSGNASDPTVWSGGAVPVSGDRVLICSTHTVTLDGTFEWGDDSTATVVINSVSTTASIYIVGTLKASRTVNSQLTCNGDIKTAQSFSATIDYGRTLIGSGVQDPIPLGVSAKLILNKSATLAASKYGLYVDNGAAFYCAGAEKNPNSTLMATAAAGQPNITVNQADGWVVGDKVVVATTNLNYTQTEEKVVLSVNASGTYPIVTFTTNLSYQHLARGIAGNFTSNVVFTSYSHTLYPGYNAHYWTDTQPVNTREYCYTLFSGLGNTNMGSYKDACLSLMASSTTAAYLVNPRIKACMFDAASNANTLQQGLQLNAWRQGYTVDDCASYAPNAGNNYAFLTSIRAVLNRCFSYRGAYGFRGPGGATTILNNCKFHGSSTTSTGGWSGSYLELNNCHLDASGKAYVHIVTGSVVFNNCDIGSLTGFPTGYANVQASGYNSQAQIEFKNCTIHSTLSIGWNLTATTRLQDCTPDTFYKITNKNGDLTQHELYYPGGGFVRENALCNRSNAAIKCIPWNVGVSAPATYTQTFAAPNGIAQTVVGALRKNAAYGASTLPSVTISGLGITPVTYAMTNSVDTWEQFALTVTNSSGADGNLTLTFSGQSANSGAACYLDGIPSSPFVTWVRHYGYTYDPANMVRTTNPVTQLTESAASALTGISYSTGTLTISQPHTMREVYDWMQWYECINRLTPILTSTDGIGFALAANLILSAALTGTGTLAMPTGTLTNTGTSTLAITHNAGVLVSIAVTGYTIGSRLQIYDVTSGVELYNAEPAASSLSLNANWAADHTLRLRVGYAVGTTAKVPIETTGMLTSAGANFLVSQEDDAVYNALAINGGTCTEFAPDYPNLQIDLSDGDGVTSVQRLYAWAAWSQTSALGMALMFRGVTALDTANYVINVGVVNARLDNVSGVPVIVAGGYLSRSDGSTVIAPTSGSIQMDAGKAFIASGSGAADIAAAVWAYTQ